MNISNINLYIFTLYLISVIIAINGIIIFILTGSLIISFSYFPVQLFIYQLIAGNITISFLTDVLLPSLIGYFYLLFFISIITWIIRRNISDSWLDQIRTYGHKFSIKRLAISLVISLVELILLKNYYLFFGSLLSSIGFSFFGEITDVPLVLLSWIIFPYSISPKIRTENKGICIGKIVGVLSKGSILDSSLGNITTTSKYKWIKLNQDFCVNFSNSKNFNSIIIGTSGSGKSSLATLISKKLNVSFTIFDLHGEYSIPNAVKIDMSKVTINPLSLFGRSPKERALEVSYMLKSLFNLGNIQTIELSNLILEAYMEKGIDPDDMDTWKNPTPNFRDLLLLLERKKKAAITSQDISKYQSIEPYLIFLSSTIFTQNNVNIIDILEKNCVLDFSTIPTNEVKHIVMETILKGIQSYMYLEKFPDIRKMIIIDEAPFLLSKDSSRELINRLFSEGRKFGFGFVVISQTVDYVKDLFGNAYLTFVLNVLEPRESEYLSRYFGGQDNDMYLAVYETLQKLPRGFFIVRDLLGRFIYLVQADFGE
ncbi:ATP-binding protein [Sulfolobus acidocaldarius]|uniref:ATP-binding protein n=1 Tax=Sulfolobus acidocaldarius TaxID=2285 RepID=UPI001E3D4C98|nr:DUF87 domain-containing protein [Sulfolobus acidocaldarius]